MAFDFPNSPTIGQTATTPNGSIFTWDGVKWTASATSGAGFANAAGRNLVHNPLFQVAQRGVGPFTVAGNCIDRWFMNFVNGTMSTSQVVLTDADRAAIGDEAAKYGLQSVFTGGGAAASATQIQQAMEDVRRTANKTITVSFWAKAASGTPKIGVGATQFFGGGGSPSAAVNITAIPVTISTTFARYSVTLTIPSIAGKILGTDGADQFDPTFWYSSGSTNNTLAGGIGVQSGTITLWGVQCEIGNLLTPLEKPDIATDLMNCCRFYQLSLILATYPAAGLPGVGMYGTAYLSPMRVLPLVAIVANSSSNVSGLTLVADGGANNNIIVYASATATASGACTLNVVFSASADL